MDSSPALTYRFGNTSHPGPFSIDRFGGRVVLTGELDAEARAEYTLQVVASDGLHEATTELTVRVADLNDNPPRFEQVAYITTLSGTFTRTVGLDSARATSALAQKSPHARCAGGSQVAPRAYRQRITLNSQINSWAGR